MSKRNYIDTHYKNACETHGYDESDMLREMFCAGVASGIGLGNDIRDDKLTLSVEKVVEINHAVVDAMEYGGGAPDQVAGLRAAIEQDAENFRRNARSSFEA